MSEDNYAVAMAMLPAFVNQRWLRFVSYLNFGFIFSNCMIHHVEHLLNLSAVLFQPGLRCISYGGGVY